MTEIQFVRERAAAGESAGMIASQLMGRTRNAVIGIWTRHSIPRNGNKSPTAPKRYKRVRTNGQRIMPTIRSAPNRKTIWQEPPVAQLECVKVGLLDLEDCHCRFPLNERDDCGIMYCGNPVWGESSWCLGHAQIVFEQRRQWRR